MRLVDATYAPEGQPILERFGLELALGQATAIVGRSGCGKSTLLRVLAGLRPLHAGAVADVPARKSFVFQDAALLPWLTLRQNVALPGRFGKAGDVAAAMAEVDLVEHAEKLPRALSGGQRMRASLARALVAEPELVLLDEAFAALDGMTRRAVQRSFLRLAEAHAWTVVMVTHELEDAVRLADRVIAVDGPPLRVIADMPIPLGRPRDLADARAPALAEDLERAIAGLGEELDPEPTEERPW